MPVQRMHVAAYDDGQGVRKSVLAAAGRGSLRDDPKYRHSNSDPTGSTPWKTGLLACVCASHKNYEPGRRLPCSFAHVAIGLPGDRHR